MTSHQWIWLVAVALFGACIGSFLNVVIYRLARGMSVHRPARSFCPGCERTIGWYDNIPLVSYLALGGRCRHCGMAISVRYPVIEALTVLLFVLAYDMFFLGPARPEFCDLGTDWPVFLAHLVLLAALVVTSAIDIEGYWIDVTITYAVVIVGTVAHALWTPQTSAAFPRPWSVTAAGAAAATIGLVLAAVFWRRKEYDSGAESNDLPEESDRPARSRSGLPVAWLMAVVIVVWIGMVGVDADRLGDVDAFWVRAGVVMATCFLVLVCVGMSPTQAEADVLEAIHEERPQARREAGAELAWLAPSIVLGILAAVVVSCTAAGGRLWEEALAWTPLEGSWRPIWGMTTALSGFVVGGAIGWGVRIVFTLVLGKEAFGLGDVHLMAAAGAVAGWPVVAAGFFLACPLAVAAVLLWLVRKRSRAVWFGPWLSLGLVAAMTFYAPIAARVGTMLEVLGWLAGATDP